MVNFQQHRARMEPSRSMPMSVLNQHERSTKNARATSRVVPVKRLPSRSRSSDHDDDPPHTSTPSRSFTPQHQHATHGSGLVLSASKSLSSNPYSNSRVKARRTQSGSAAAARSKFMNRERSSSPSKKDQQSSSLCVSSPAECLIPSSSKRRHTSSSSSSYGIIKAILRALGLLLVGFGAGMAYNMWEASQYGTHGNHIMDLESIPSVLLTDELVKKLAHDNQLQEAEIHTLKEQVEEARKMAQEREQMLTESENNNHAIQSHDDIPDQISIRNIIASGNGGRVYRLTKAQAMDARLRSPAMFQNPPAPDQQQPSNPEQEQPPKEKPQHPVSVPEVPHYLTEKEYQEHYQQQHQQRQEYQETFHSFLFDY